MLLARSQPGRVLLGAIFPLLMGCVSHVVPTGSSPAAFDPAAGVAVVFAHSASPGTGEGTAREMVQCVQQALRDTQPEIRVVSPTDFLRAAFPGLGPAEAPLSQTSLVELLRADDWRQRVMSAGSRYLVVLRGGTSQPAPWGAGSCGPGLGGGGACAGFWLWDRDSRFVASIVDLREAATLGEVDAKVSGRPFLLVLAVPVAGAPSFTEGRACSELGAGVARFLQPGGR